MNKPAVILYERTGRWAAAIMRHLPAAVELVQVRGRDQCLACLAEAPTSIVAFEFTAKGVKEPVELASQITRRYPWSTIVALAGDEATDFEQLSREAGIAHVFQSPRELAPWPQIVERHFARIPLEPVEFAESVWRSLPWNSAAKA
jgi:hypothetical protein